MAGGPSILWRRLDRPGHESARLSIRDSTRVLAGTAVFAHDGEACRLDYEVVCNRAWRTLAGRISGWVGSEIISLEIAVSSHRWYLGGMDCREVAGALDLDLEFSPSTNLLPIRRLNLEIGQEAPVRAAWLRFPGLYLEPLEQVYRRTGPTTYRYESAGGAFSTDLEVDETGFVTLYPDLWRSAAGGR
jgi:uncharacterized protein